MADEWNNSDRDKDEQALGTEEIRGVEEDDDEFAAGDELDEDELEDEEEGPSL